MVKNLPANAEVTGAKGSVPGLGRSSGGGNGNQLQSSYHNNPTDREAWWATVHGAAESGMFEVTAMHARGSCSSISSYSLNGLSD